MTSGAPGDRPSFIVFARAPDVGRVKTRLAAELGDAKALEIYRGLGLRTLAVVRAAAATFGGSRVVVYHTPADAARRVAAWLGDDVELGAQSDGDLGARMAAAIGAELARGATAVVVVGVDCPALDADVLARAVASLATADVVFGPASDGGYYLVAARQAHAALFDDIPWSSPSTLGATLRAAERSGLRVALLGVLTDIDTAADWRAWSAQDGARRV